MPCHAVPCHSALAAFYVGPAQTGACVSDLVSLKGLAAGSPSGDNPSAPRTFFSLNFCLVGYDGSAFVH